MLIDSPPSCPGTVLQTAAFSVAQFAVGRFIVGLGVGSAAMICPLYIGELVRVCVTTIHRKNSADITVALYRLQLSTEGG